jgi:transposase
MQQMLFNTKHKAEGRLLFHPKVFLRLYLYGYMNSVRSSHKLETECIRNKEVYWLNGRLNYFRMASMQGKLRDLDG